MAAGLGAAIGNAYGPLNSLWATPIYMILGSWAVIVGDQLDRKMF